MDDEMRREVDVNIPHRNDLTGILEPTFYLHIGKGSIPRQIDLASDECLNQGIVVRIEHPIELDAMPTKMHLGCRVRSSVPLFVAWDEAKYIIGIELVVDGGLTVNCVGAPPSTPALSPS